MASCTSPLLPSSLFLSQDFRYFSPLKIVHIRRRGRSRAERGAPAILTVTAANAVTSEAKPAKLVSFLGKGGSGKTTAAVFAAQYYAMLGLKTCLVIHSQDPTAEFLLNRKIGASPVECDNNLSAVRLETTKMILEPLKKFKQADAQLNMTQGILEGVVFWSRRWLVKSLVFFLGWIPYFLLWNLNDSLDSSCLKKTVGNQSLI